MFKCLSGAKTFSAEFLQQLQSQPYNRFQKGMKVEVADRKNMYSMCVATIVDVIGDRLRMRYDGLDDDAAEDFWCHYQSSEIHPIGWSSLVGHTLQPPIGKLTGTLSLCSLFTQISFPVIWGYNLKTKHECVVSPNELIKVNWPL